MPADWDTWLAAQGISAGFCQSSTWARIHLAVNGAHSFVLAVSDRGVPRAGMLVSVRPPPSVHGGIANLRRWLSGERHGTIECFEGPVLTGADKPAQLVELLQQLDDLGARLGVRSFRFSGAPPGADWGADEGISAVFRHFGYDREPWLTSLVDLRREEEELLGSFKHAARKGIRKCLDAGLRVRVCGDYDDYLRSFRLPYDAAKGAEKRATARSDAELWRIDDRRHYRFLVVEDSDGVVHATLGTYAFNGVATEIMSGRTTAGLNANLPAQDLVHWEAFRVHRAAGDRWFNLAGYSAAPQNAKELGIRRFKEKWNGTEVVVPQFRRVDIPVTARLARRLATRLGSA